MSITWDKWCRAVAVEIIKAGIHSSYVSVYLPVEEECHIHSCVLLIASSNLGRVCLLPLIRTVPDLHTTPKTPEYFQCRSLANYHLLRCLFEELRRLVQKETEKHHYYTGEMITFVLFNQNSFYTFMGSQKAITNAFKAQTKRVSYHFS